MHSHVDPRTLTKDDVCPSFQEARQREEEAAALLDKAIAAAARRLHLLCGGTA